ncbi:MAG: hypothetical protein ACYS8L_00015 [Planctomycetota bacterium]|jgi:hypothetical protein
MRTWIVALAVLSIVGSAAAGEVSVRLTDAPRQIGLPLAEGDNVILTARVDGDVRSLWLARSRDARARYLLDCVGEGIYQVNLADPVLSAMLEAAGPGQMRVFAESPDGIVAESVPVHYTVRRTAWKWHPPPRVFVHTKQATTEVTESLQTLGPEDVALLAELRGQGVAVMLPSWSGLSLGAGDKDVTAWFEPSAVELIEVRFDADAGGTSSRARAGEHEWELAATESRPATHELAVTTAVRDAWEHAGELTITCSQDDMDDLRVVLRMPPGELDLPEGEARFTINQRRRELLPGSDGYVQVHIGDITAGQTMLTLKTADGRELIKRRSVRQGTSVQFRLGENEYELSLRKLINLLVGDDYAEFVVAPHAGEEAPAETPPAKLLEDSPAAGP